jgi:hypothetical protein
MVAAEMQLVSSEEEMDDKTFTKHMNARHKDSLGRLNSLWLADPYVHQCWRNFHWRLHELRVDLEHEHAE